MNLGEPRCRVYQNMATGEWEMAFCYADIQGGKRGSTYLNLYDGTSYFKPEGERLDEKFIMRFSYDLGSQMLKAIVEALDGKGIKPDSDAIREGKIEAMKAHLEDMRQLVFKGKAPAMK